MGTSISISILNNFFIENKNEWCLIEEKSINYLKKKNLLFLMNFTNDAIKTLQIIKDFLK
jgi:hypothetical protein